MFHGWHLSECLGHYVLCEVLWECILPSVVFCSATREDFFSSRTSCGDLFFAIFPGRMNLPHIISLVKKGYSLLSDGRLGSLFPQESPCSPGAPAFACLEVLPCLEPLGIFPCQNVIPFSYNVVQLHEILGDHRRLDLV